MHVQQTVLTEIVDEVLADRFDAVQRRAIDERRDIVGAAVGRIAMQRLAA